MSPRLCSDAQASTNVNSSKKAEKWLARVEKESLALVLAWGGTELDPGHQPQPVRIAIIDTGIAKSHDAFKGKFGLHGQIKGHLQFMRGGMKSDLPSGDPSGHGTHTTALLMRLAPQADIYIAQVGKTWKDIDADTVAQAVFHAVNMWKVDIISLSLGFDHNSETLSNAINTADEHKVLVFAAASNGGFNDQITRKFPARMSKVISVNATNAPGTYAADFNPGLGQEDLATLGIDVPSAWPGQTGCADRRAKSGTSMATPILASFGAAALHFVRQQIIEPENPPDSDVSTEFWSWLERFLKTKDGMQRMLHCMSAPDQKNFRYVRPWQLFNMSDATRPRKSRMKAARKIFDHFSMLQERTSQEASVGVSTVSRSASEIFLEAGFIAPIPIVEVEEASANLREEVSVSRAADNIFDSTGPGSISERELKTPMGVAAEMAAQLHFQSVHLLRKREKDPITEMLEQVTTRQKVLSQSDLARILKVCHQFTEGSKDEISGTGTGRYDLVEEFRERIKNKLVECGLPTITAKELQRRQEQALTDPEATFDKTLLVSVIDRLSLGPEFTFKSDSIRYMHDDYVLPDIRQGFEALRCSTINTINTINSTPGPAMFFNLDKICASEAVKRDVFLHTNPGLLTCILPDKHGNRCFPFLFIEAEELGSSFDRVSLTCLREASQALYNIWSCIKRAGSPIALTKLRTFSVAVSTRRCEIRVHSATMSKADENLTFFHDVVDMPIPRNCETLSLVIQSILQDYASSELLPILRDTITKLTHKIVEETFVFTKSRDIFEERMLERDAKFIGNLNESIKFAPLHPQISRQSSIGSIDIDKQAYGDLKIQQRKRRRVGSKPSQAGSEYMLGTSDSGPDF